MRLDVARMAGIELAVDQRMDQHFGFGAIHGADPSSTVQRARSIERARASRDITVPTGTPSDLGDVAIRQVVDIAQHHGFAKRLRQRGDEPADGFVVAAAQQFRFGRKLRLLPRRQIVRRMLFLVRSGRHRLRRARRANSALQTFRRIASSHGFMAGPR